MNLKEKLKIPIQGSLNLRAPSYVSFIYLENSQITLNLKVSKKAGKTEELNVLKLTDIKGSKQHYFKLIINNSIKKINLNLISKIYFLRN